MKVKALCDGGYPTCFVEDGVYTARPSSVKGLFEVFDADSGMWLNMFDFEVEVIEE